MGDGSITINYRISDTLDLRPGDGRSGTYNAVTRATGSHWHAMSGAKEASATEAFTRRL